MALAFLTLPWLCLSPLLALICWVATGLFGFICRRRVLRMIRAAELAELPLPLRLAQTHQGLQLAIGVAPAVPLRDAWRVGRLDVLYPAAGAPQLLWPDSLLPADRARLRALLSLHPGGNRENPTPGRN